MYMYMYAALLARMLVLYINFVYLYTKKRMCDEL